MSNVPRTGSVTLKASGIVCARAAFGTARTGAKASNTRPGRARAAARSISVEVGVNSFIAPPFGLAVTG